MCLRSQQACLYLGRCGLPGQNVVVYQSESESSSGPLQLQQVQLLPEDQHVLWYSALAQQEHVVCPQGELRPGDVEDGQDGRFGAQRLVGGGRRGGRERERDRVRESEGETETTRRDHASARCP